MVTRALDQTVLGVVLAGGRSARFGADKAAAMLGGQNLLTHVCDRAAGQVDTLLVNHNNDAMTYQRTGYETLADEYPDHGPLAGVLAGLAYASACGHAYVAIFACDMPFVPHDCVTRLRAGLDATDADYAIAWHGGREHRAAALWRMRCLTPLSNAFAGGLRSLHGVSNVLNKTVVEFPFCGDAPDGNAFFNINTFDDLARAQQWLNFAPAHKDLRAQDLAEV